MQSGSESFYGLVHDSHKVAFLSQLREGGGLRVKMKVGGESTSYRLTGLGGISGFLLYCLDPA